MTVQAGSAPNASDRAARTTEPRVRVQHWSEIELRPSLLAATTSASPALPVLAALGVLAIYILSARSEAADWLRRDPVLFGTVIGLVVGAGLVVIRLPWTTARRANPDVFADLTPRLDDLHIRLTTLAATSAAQELPFRTALTHYNQILRTLAQPGPQWVLGTGYVLLTELAHRADESLIAYDPPSRLASRAVYDELRLTGSKMDSRDDLLAKLRLAVAVLGPAASSYLTRQAPAPTPVVPVPASPPTTPAPPPTTPAPPPTTPPPPPTTPGPPPTTPPPSVPPGATVPGVPPHA